MRSTLICIVIFSAFFIALAYTRNPTGCREFASNIGRLVTLLASKHVDQAGSGQPGAPDAASSVATVPTPEPAPTPVPASTTALTPVEGTSAVQAVPGPSDLKSSPTPAKSWAPPAVIPAQPNWTWTTSDGKTYQNVVIEKINSDTVRITHSAGVTQIDISTLPADIQKQLNFDPDAAAAATAEQQREEQRPFYSFAERADAQALARQRHWPLAWLCSMPIYMTEDPSLDPEAEATQMAFNHLKSQVVIIFVNGSADFGASPVPVHDQFIIMDDGPVPGGHHFLAPKVVFSNPDATRTLGRVCYTQMKAAGEVAIDAVLSAFPKDPDVQTMVNGNPASEPQPTPPASSPVATEPTAK